MIFTKLETIPYKLFIKISQTKHLRLLAPDNPEMTIDDLNHIWENIHSEYLELNPSPDDKRILKIHSEIYYFQAKYNYILIACRILAFDYDEWTINNLIEYGYSLTHENYVTQIERIQAEAEGLLVKADAMASELPTIDEDKSKHTVDDMLASYSVFLNIDFDFNTIPASKVIALGKQIDLKIKATTSKK